MYVMRTVSGAMELPWDRIGRHHVGPVLLVAKDRVSRQTMFFPRVLVPDAWLAHLTRAA